VRFTLAAPLGEGQLPDKLRAAGVVLADERRALVCPIDEGRLAGLLAAVAALPGARVVDVRTEQPTLEQVFLALTGDERRRETAPA
jgi:hypothetical protein